MGIRQNIGHTGNVGALAGGVHKDDHNEADSKRHTLVDGVSSQGDWCTRSGCLTCQTCSQHVGPVGTCGFGGYSVETRGDVLCWHSPAIALILAAQGQRVVMAKLVFMHATQSSYKNGAINWGPVGSKSVAFATAICGGSWSDGALPCCYNCSNAGGLYVCLVGPGAIWMCRNAGGCVGKVHLRGYTQAC